MRLIGFFIVSILFISSCNNKTEDLKLTDKIVIDSLTSTYYTLKAWDTTSVRYYARGDFKAKAKREENQIVESSGYEILFANPHLSWSINKKLSFATNLELPVYKYYNGIQLANSFSYSARISYKF